MTWIGVTGEIGAGKTAISREVAARSGAAYASFGDHVRAEAQRRSLPSERTNLQDLGEALLKDLGAEEFARCVLEETSAITAESLVIEGVRHVSVDDVLREFAGKRGYFLVFVTTPMSVREVRLVRRGEPPQKLGEFDQHATENDVHARLRQRADVVVPGEDLEEAVRRVLELLPR
jgi:dephospho-CoA kinase